MVLGSWFLVLGSRFSFMRETRRSAKALAERLITSELQNFRTSELQNPEPRIRKPRTRNPEPHPGTANLRTAAPPNPARRTPNAEPRTPSDHFTVGLSALLDQSRHEPT